jgi:glycosyltransferase involved in cell wall biosynthesis
MPKVKILYIEQNIDGTIGGSYYSLLYLVKGLDKTRYDPLVGFYAQNTLLSDFQKAGIKTILFKRRKPINILTFKNIRKHKIIYYVLKPINLLINMFHTLILPGIYNGMYLRNNRINIVHLNNSILSGHEWMLGAKIARIACLTHQRGINNSYPLFARYFGKRLNAVICISKAVKENIEKKVVGINNCALIYNGLNPMELVAKNEKEVILNRYKIEKGNPIIGIVGNIREWKGQEIVLKALTNLVIEFPDIKCFIVGETTEDDRDYYENLKKLIYINRIQDNVIFAGYIKEIGDILNVLDVIIHASIRPEPFGRVILESMALKKPVIATNIGGPKEIVLDEITGFLTPPGDVEELSKKTSFLLRNREISAKMGKMGYERLTNSFQIEENVNRTQEIYRKITKNMSDEQH